ncbi:hypothetical protein An16g05000 [Aspergillus niger]|uniref:Uncharacterized protein n=2 Tax=Aspergillus niger TaxID=5061 RepID=A2R7W6_ASPNC|nr:hypothetical protein An16g05000 [Aspergillus niger]CAK97354.1 hypothetical protein An16g05000 [Aspergillus niger]
MDSDYNRLCHERIWETVDVGQDQDRCANFASLDHWRELRSKYKLPSASRFTPVYPAEREAKLGTGKG